jgi:3-oxoacyl-[acyl-carrier-protein] synthase II
MEPGNMSRSRVVVTGMGVISPIGLGTEQFWKSCLSGKVGIDRVSHFDPEGYGSQIAGEVRDFDPEQYMEKVEARKLDRFCQMAVAASEDAFKAAGLASDRENPERMGVLVGSGIGGIGTFEEQHSRLLDRGPSRVSPFFVPKMIIDMAPGIVSMRLNLKGPNFGAVSACASGTHAMGTALRILQRGDADVMLAGGAEAAVTPMTLAGFSSMKALSTRNDDPKRASRPFDKDRDGFVLAEGAGMLVFETLEHALGRGAEVLAEVAGFGATADAYHMTAPAPGGEGAARAMRLALADAGVNAEDVSYINAHGTSTPHNDPLETAAIKTVFGEHAYKIPISSTKSMIGHLLGAAGGVELVACVMSIRDNVVHATVNHEVPDEECDLDYVPGAAREVDVNVVISNSFGFGGHNASIVLRGYKG